MANKKTNYSFYGLTDEEVNKWYANYMSSQDADTLKKQADDAYRAYQEALNKPNTSKNSASVMKTYNDYADKIRRISEFQSYHGSKSVIPNFQQIEQQYSDAFTSYNDRRNEFRNQRLPLFYAQRATAQGVKSSKQKSKSNQANDYYKQLEFDYNDVKNGYRFGEYISQKYKVDLDKWKSNPNVSDDEAALSFLANQMQTYKAKTGFHAIQSQRATDRRDAALASSFLMENPEASYDEAVYGGQMQYIGDAYDQKYNQGKDRMYEVAKEIGKPNNVREKYAAARYDRIRTETLEKIKTDPKTSPEYQTAKESLDKLDALADIRESAARATGTSGEIAGAPAEQIASRLREIGLYDQNAPLTLDYIDQIISSVNTDIGRSRAVLTANGYDWDKIQEYIQQERNEEKMQSRVEEARQYASESPVAASIQSAGLNFASGVGYLGSIPQMLSNAFGGIDNYKPIDVNSSDFAATQLTTAIRDQVAQDLNEGNPDFQFLTMDTGELYNVGMSMLDNVIQLAVGAGVGKAFGAAGVAAKNATEAVTLSTMGMSAASSEFLNLTNQGAPASQAFTLATLSGAIEIATEKIGLDNLFKVGSSKTIGELFKNMASQAASEGMEESISEVLNSAADYLIRGNDSEFMQAVEAKVASGMAPEDAYKSALKEVASAMIKSGIGGALSGLGFGVGGTAVGVYAGNTNAAIGADIRQSGNVKSLQEIARDYSIALSENPSDSEIGSAYKAVKKNAPSIAVEQRLQELGDTSSAKTATKAVQGKRLTRSQKTESEINAAAEQVISEWNRNDVSWSQKLRDAKEKLSGMRSSDFIGAFAEKMQLAPEYRDELKKSWSDYVKSGSTDLNQAEFTIQWLADYAQDKMKQDFQVQQEKNETQTVVSSEQTSATGPEVAADIPESGISVYSVAENKVSVDGEILNVNDPKVPEDTARAVRILSRISNITTEDVNKILPEVLSADSQTRAARIAAKAFELGKIGDRVAAENIKENYGLTKDQIMKIYNSGLGNSRAKSKNTQKIIDDIVHEFEGKSKKKVGEVIVDEKASDITEDQAAQVALIREVYASALGNKWHITKSYVNDKNERVINVDGVEIVNANGVFVSKNGDIWLDVNANKSYSRPLLAAASHEIVHFIKQFNPDSFQTLSEFLAEQYISSASPFDKRIARIADKYGISKEAAHEEFVAESFSRMLYDKNLSEKVVKLTQKDKTLVQKILESINKIIEKINNLLGNTTVSIPANGKLIASKDILEKASDIFANAIEKSGRAFKATGGAFVPTNDYAQIEDINVSQENSDIRKQISGIDKILTDKITEKDIKKIVAENKRANKKIETLESQKKRLKNLNQKKSETIQEQKESIRKIRKSKKRKESVQRLESKVKLLSGYLLKNPKESTVFTGMRKPVADILKAIDLSKSKNTAEGKTKIYIQLKKLANIYEQVIDEETRFYSSEDAPDPVAVFDLPFIDEMNQFIDEISDIPLYEMTQEQIDRVIKFLDTVISEVRDANKAVVNGRKVETETIGRRFQSEIDTGKKISATALKTPIEVFEEMGSPTAMKLFKDILDAENKYGEVIVESKNKMESIYEKYGAKKWDWNRNVKLISRSGDTFEITLGQAIYFYALYNREAGKRHIDNGGFVPVSDRKDRLDNKIKHKNQTDAYTIADDQIKKIEEFIGENGKNFAKDIVSYFSNDLAKKGNYVSRLRHGINLFQEKWYCPIFTSSIYRDQNFSPLGDPKIENAGPTQQLNPRATSAVNLVDIRSAFSSHVNFMANYYASVLPLKAFESIYNWKDWEKGADSKRTRTLIANKFGKKTEEFITNFIRDLNGGIRVDRGDEIGRKLLSLSKQSMTALSASVALQQLTSIVRAYPEISPIYFSPIPEVRIQKVWEEMRKYSPFVVLKEMGGMDISSGMKLDEYLFGRGTDRLSKIRSGVDKASFGIPEAMDKYTWVQIWRAVKKEVASKQNFETGSKEYYEAVNRRFHDVIAKTQVYDSTASKAAIMRSKNTFTQEMTSFTSEPLLTLNTLFRAVNNLKTGKPGKSAAIILGAIGSQMASNLITALFGVLRGDDEETPFEEQFLSNFIQDSIDSFPLLNIPYVRQAWSIMNGFDVNSMSFEQFSNTWNSLTKLLDLWQTDTTDMTEEEIEQHDKEKGSQFIDLVLRSLSFAKLPFYNLRRDVKSFSRLGTVFSSENEVTEQSLKDAAVEGLPEFFKMFGIGDAGTDEKLYTAIMIGDSEYAERFLAKYETESEKNSAIRSALKKNDGRVREAADARIEKNYDLYEELVDEMVASGFDEKIVISAVESYLPEEETEESKPKEKARYSGEELTQAALDGDRTTFENMKNDIMETDMQNGKSETESSDGITSTVSGVLTDLFKDDEVSENEVRTVLESYLELDDAKIDKKILDMQTLKKYGVSYSEKKEAYWSGELSKSDLKSILLDYDYEEDDAEYQIIAYEWERDHPGHDSYTASAVRDYTEHLAGSSVSIDTYLSARDLYNDQKGDKDENGESIPYSKMVKVFEAWRSLNAPADQLTDLAYTFWPTTKKLNKYKWW